MTAQDVDKIIPFPGARRAPGPVQGTGGERVNGTTTASTSARWELVAPLLGWGGTALAAVAAPSPESPDKAVFYAGTTAGCYRSDDGGVTWAARNDGLTSPYIQALVASPHFSKDRTLFAGTLGSGVMRSTNGGETWGPVEFWQGAPAVTALAVSPAFPEEGTILAGTQSDGIYRSTNGGRTWSSANFGINDLSIL